MFLAYNIFEILPKYVYLNRKNCSTLTDDVALDMAADTGYVEIVELLLEFGADPKIQGLLLLLSKAQSSTHSLSFLSISSSMLQFYIGFFYVQMAKRTRPCIGAPFLEVRTSPLFCLTPDVKSRPRTTKGIHHCISRHAR